MLCYVGVEVYWASIVRHGDSLGHVHHKKIRLPNPDTQISPPSQRRMEKLAMICLAGPIAQKVYAPHSFRRVHASDDVRDAEAAAMYVNETTDALDAWLKWIEVRTAQFIRSNWSVIEAVALTLLRMRTMTGAEIRRVILDA
jgi:hypothetical protein